MNYPRIFERVYNQPLLITQARFYAIHQFLLPRMFGSADMRGDAMLSEAGAKQLPTKNYRGQRKQMATPLIDFDSGRILDERLYTFAKPGVAVVPVYGVLAKNLSAYEEACGGGVDINPIAHALTQAENDPEVEKVVIDFATPGGEATGVPETAAKIARLGLKKPVIGFCDSLSASGGMWLMSQCSETYITSSARLGSIGVYSAWLDETVALEMKGLKLELFTAGKHKAAGAPFRGLTDEERGMMQENVETIHAEFKTAVRAGRGAVEDSVMEGQVFRASEAVAHNLADGIVADWEEFVEMV